MRAQHDFPASVLLLCESTEARDALSGMFETSWLVEAQSEPQEALRAAWQHRPSAVVADAALASRDDWQFLNALRRGTTADVPLLLIAPPGDPALRDACFAAGADDFMVEPVSQQELRKRVGLHVELAQLRSRVEKRDTFSAIVESAPVPICVLEGDELRFVLVNEAASEVMRKDFVIGKRLADILPETRSTDLDSVLRETMRNAAPIRPASMVLSLSCGENNERRSWALIPARLDRGPDEVARIMVAFTDVTEQLRAREALRSMAADKDASNKAKDQLIAMLGHELRNPLSTIGSALELMQLIGSDTREQAIIKRQVGHMVRLVDDLLDLSRISRGKVTLIKQRIELSEIVHAAVESVSPLLEHRRQTLELHLPKGLYLMGDPGRLRQVFANLLDNAAKYSDFGSRVVVRAEELNGEVRLSVVDQGLGIDPARLEQIFELFVQENDATQAAGAGLGVGLAIVRSIVRMHNGEVRAHSEGLGKGSELIVVLPSSNEQGGVGWQHPN